VTGSRPRSRSRWSYLWVLWPLPLAVVIAVAQDALYQVHCGPLHTVDVIFSLDKHPRGCTKLTLSADVPSLLLGISAAIAAWLYRASHQAWEELQSELEKTEVLAYGRPHLFAARGETEERLHWCTTSLWGRLMTACVVIGVGVGFYAITFAGAHLFHDYAAGEHLARGMYKQVRDLWWANWHRYPLLAAMWIIVGSAGVYWAALDLMSFARRALTLHRLSSSEEWHFVASRSCAGHPWDPLLRLTNLRIWGLVTFLLAFVDIIYLARDVHAGGAKNIALAAMAVIVLLVTAVPSRLYYRAVQAAYEGSIDRERRRLRQLVEAASQADYPALSYLTLCRLELSYESVRPTLSAVTRITHMAVIAAAVAGFLASVLTLSVG
jgi:hypothetical protein